MHFSGTSLEVGGGIAVGESTVVGSMGGSAVEMRVEGGGLGTGVQGDVTMPRGRGTF